MRNTGTEQLVVLMNPRNGGGAKGLCYPVLFEGQPKGKNPLTEQSHSGWDDGSRMRQEAHVRF